MRLVNWVDGFNVLDFDNNEIFYDQIDPVAEIDALAVINHWPPYLLCHSDAQLAQFVGKAGFISAFKEPGTEMRMNIHCARDHSAGNSVDTRGADYCGSGHDEHV